MSRIGIVGGGASGLMAAYAAATFGDNEVFLFEKNEKLGKKIYITGKGRCNVTNNCDSQEFFSNVVSNPKFLLSAINNFAPADLMELLEDSGLRLKTERGNRVYPASDKASDVTKYLEKIIKEKGVRIMLNSEVSEILHNDGSVCGLKCNGEEISLDKVIICTGGASYPATGSTGDGYRFAVDVGHTITPIKPALVGIRFKGNEFADLQGLSLKNVRATVFEGNKRIFSDFGEMLFTHFGVSGPIILTASSMINRRDANSLTLSVDLKPALSEEVLDARILRDFSEQKNKDISNALFGLLPRSLVGLVIKRSMIDPYKKVNEITVKERKALVAVLKGLNFEIEGLRPIEEGIVTSGGVCVKEIDPKTMESKIIKGLYFAGEVLDVDALTGGFNLQIAFSTGYAAGRSVNT